MQTLKSLRSLIFLASFFLFFNPLFAAVPKPNTTPIGLVIWSKGNVSAAEPNQPARKLARRSPIFANDVITSDATSTAQIAFTDTSVYSIDKGTEFKIADYAFKKSAKPADDKSVMTLVKGGFRSITGNIAKANPDGYQVNTPVATIGVRGTQFSALISPTKGTLFKIDKGSIKVSNKAGTIQLGDCKGCSLQSGTCKDCALFASVTSVNMAPQPLAKMPTEFASQPPIAPASKSDMNALDRASNGAVSGGTGRGPGGGGGSSSGSGGFCIS